MVVVPRRVAELHSRHEHVGLHPADEQFSFRQQRVVPVSSYHVRQDERVADDVEVQQRRDERAQAVQFAPDGALVHHAREDRHVLGGPAGAHFGQAPEPFHVPHVRRREAVGRRVGRQLRGQIEAGRQPVGLAGVDLEAVEAVINAEALDARRPPFGRALAGEVEVAGRLALPPARVRRVPLRVAHQMFAGRREGRAFRVDERVHPERDPESLIDNARAAGVIVSCSGGSGGGVHLGRMSLSPSVAK